MNVYVTLFALLQALQKAASLTVSSLRQSHQEIWRALWTTGFGLSHSKADHAVNGDHVNATMYYVLAHIAAPIHGMHLPAKEKEELSAQLAYSEGCYGGLPTL